MSHRGWERFLAWMCLMPAAAVWGQTTAGKPFLIDARGPKHERRVLPRQMGGSSGVLVEHGPHGPALRLRMSVDNDRVERGRSASVAFMLTNTSKKPMTIPISIDSADIEPADPSQGYEFRELLMGVWVVPEGATKSARGLWVSLGPAPDLYGDPSVLGTTHVLQPGQSAEIRADLPFKPEGVGPQLAPRPHKITASAVLSVVSVSSSNGSLSQFGAEVVHAQSSPVKVEIVPPN
jgi:hypothetical protein